MRKLSVQKSRENTVCIRFTGAFPEAIASGKKAPGKIKKMGYTGNFLAGHNTIEAQE
jgi:hypothetical protein